MANPTPSDLLAHVSEPTYSITEPLTNGVFMTKDNPSLSSYEASYEAGYRDGAAALKAATEQAEHWAQAHREERVLRDVATERAEVAEREIVEYKASAPIGSMAVRLGNQALRIRKLEAELEALRAKPVLSDEAYKETIARRLAAEADAERYKAALDEIQNWTAAYASEI